MFDGFFVSFFASHFVNELMKLLSVPDQKMEKQSQYQTNKLDQKGVLEEVGEGDVVG